MTVNLTKATPGSFVTQNGGRVAPHDTKPAVTTATQLPPPPAEITLSRDVYEAAPSRLAGAAAADTVRPAWSEVALQTLSDGLCALSAARPDVSLVAVTLGALEAADPYTYPDLLDAALKELGLTPDSKVDTLLGRLEQLRPDDQGLKNVASLLATALQHIPE